MRLKNWQDLTQAVEADTKDKTAPTLDVTISEMVAKTSHCDSRRKSRTLYSWGSTGGQVRLSIHVCWWIYDSCLTRGSVSFRLWKTWFSIQIWTNSVVPLLFFKASSDAAKNGLENVLYFLAMISINIGFFNLIPIPALMVERLCSIS